MKTALAYDDDERMPKDPFGPGVTKLPSNALRDSLMSDVNRTEALLMSAGGEATVDYNTSSASVYQGMSWGGGSSVSYENKPCEVCGTKGMRRKWKYDLDRRKMVKDGMVSCDACSGKGWSQVATTTYHPSPYWVTNDLTPQPTVYPYPPLSPTVAPSGVPFYGSTTEAPLYGDNGVIGGPQFINGG